MLNIINALKVKTYDLVLDEKDVMNTIKVINKHHKVTPTLRVGSCGWADDTHKWFIMFSTNEIKWNKIRHELNVIRVFEISDIPKDLSGKIYTTD